MPLTDTQRDILTAAAPHPERLACPPRRLPTGARQSVAKALLRQGLVISAANAAHDATAVWTVDGESMVLRITDDGRATLLADGADTPATGPEGAPDPKIGIKAPVGPQDGDREPTATSPALNLQKACPALLEAWDASPAQDTPDNPISRAVEAVRASLQARQHHSSRTPSVPRQGTKQEMVLTLLRRTEGATIAQIMEATGWQQHTVRGFFAGLKKRQGISVTMLKRVRQVGQGAQGSRGSHSICAVLA